MGAKLPLPKEHGASAVLYGSFLAGLAVARQFHLPVLLLLAAFSAFYFAHEPISRIIQFSGRSAAAGRRLWWRRWLVIYLIAGGLFSALLLFAYGRWLLIPLGALAALLMAVRLRLLAKGREMTLAGEVLSVTGLTMTAPSAYYVSRAEFGATGALLWLVSALFFASGVFHVRMLLGRVKRSEPAGPRLRQSLVYHVTLAAALVFLVWSTRLPFVVSLAFVPLLVRAFLDAAFPRPTLNLKKTGLLEMAYSAVLIIILAVGWK
jgi:hypothetical protein